MKHAILISLYFGSIFSAAAQIKNVAEKFALPNSLSESSGAIFFNDKLITHNDSGGENKLFELDTISGLVTRTVTISNATNVDWEDITQDDSNIYIGDFGNNVSGNRTDLKIYKISKTDYITTTSVTAETISFSYVDQTDFTATTANNTEWDAEALVSFDATNLILFTKNWVNGTTKGYLIPKFQGTYSVSPLTTSLNSDGLITGGTYNPLSGKLYLVGYTNPTLQPFVWVCDNFNGSDIFSGTNTKTSLSSLSFEQAEAITFVSENRYFITSESFSQSFLSDYAKLIAFSTSDTTLSLESDSMEEEVVLYPNPVSDSLNIQGNNIILVEVYDTKSVLLYKGQPAFIDMSVFSEGVYFVKINSMDGTSLIKKILKK
ncbi:MAG: T9SS type A sorting domain-containing protein [Flavobacteriales bacterium]